MSITVQRGNPACGQVHQVKNKYAGKRCLCPGCKASMVVPAALGYPSTADVGTPTPAPVGWASMTGSVADLGEEVLVAQLAEQDAFTNVPSPAWQRGVTVF